MPYYDDMPWLSYDQDSKSKTHVNNSGLKKPSWKIAKPGTRFGDFHIPIGSVYGILPERCCNGKHYMRTYVWISDFSLVCTQRHFVVNMFSVNDICPKKVYVDGYRGWAKSMQEYIREHLSSLGKTKPQILRRDIQSFVNDSPTDAMHMKCHVKNVLIQTCEGGKFSPK